MEILEDNYVTLIHCINDKFSQRIKVKENDQKHLRV